MNGNIVFVPKLASGRHGIRSQEAEDQWLPVIGPTAYLLARKLIVLMHDESVDPDMLAASLGVGTSRLVAALRRLERYGLASVDAGDSQTTVTLHHPWPER